MTEAQIDDTLTGIKAARCWAPFTREREAASLRAVIRASTLTEPSPRASRATRRALTVALVKPIFPDRPDMQKFLQRAVGYSLTGLTNEI